MVDDEQEVADSQYDEEPRAKMVTLEKSDKDKTRKTIRLAS